MYQLYLKQSAGGSKICFSVVGGSFLIWPVSWWSVVGGSVDYLSVVRCLMEGARWSVGLWKTCRWVSGRMVVIGGLSLVGSFVIRRKKTVQQRLCFTIIY